MEAPANIDQTGKKWRLKLSMEWILYSFAHDGGAQLLRITDCQDVSTHSPNHHGFCLVHRRGFVDKAKFEIDVLH